jgi:hypothetical protein
MPASICSHYVSRYLLRVVTITLCITSIGCSAAFYGIKPDPNDFLSEGIAYCQQLHSASKEIYACADYEDAVRRARALENAYLTLERINRWGMNVGITVGLAGVGALTGLAAFGQAASDWAKIIPILGTFVGGVIAALTNELKADAYEDARLEIGKARKDAEQLIVPIGQTGRDATKYNEAQSKLNRSIMTIEENIVQKIRAGRPSPAEAAELAKQSAELKKENAILRIASKFHVSATSDPTQPTSQILITFSPTIGTDDQKLLTDNGEVRIDASHVGLTNAQFNGTTVMVPIPPSVKGASGSGAKTHTITVTIGAHSMSPTTNVTVTY